MRLISLRSIAHVLQSVTQIIILISLSGVNTLANASVSLERAIKEEGDTLAAVSASKKTLQTFVDDNPKHPLVADAKQVIAEL